MANETLTDPLTIYRPEKTKNDLKEAVHRREFKIRNDLTELLAEIMIDDSTDKDMAVEKIMQSLGISQKDLEKAIDFIKKEREIEERDQ
jgi:uncharacterized protein YeeX (DUF496 family)